MYPRKPLSLRRLSEFSLRFLAARLIVGLVLCTTPRFALAQNASSPGSNSTAATLPAATRANQPPAVRDYVQQEVEVEGELEVVYEDRESESRLLFFLNNAGERLPLHFAANPPKHLLTGARVRVKGVRVDGAVTVASGDTSLETLALDPSSTSTTSTATSAIVPNTFGVQKTVAILVNFHDNPTQKPWTLDQVRSFVFGPVSNFFLENSYQQTSVSGDVFGWYTIPVSSTTCDQLGIASYAKQAATAAGVNLSAYTHYVYLFPNNSGCQWSGTATVGGNPSQAWINGQLTLEVVAHEMGHNVGLYHSHSMLCNGTTLGTNCSAVEYGDSLDMMGGSRSAHFNAFQKERLGWLNNGLLPPITTVQTSGTYTLDPYEPPGANPKALKIYKNIDPVTGKGVWYYVEYRQAIGFDSYLATVSSLEMDGSNILNGVVIHTGSPDESGNTCYLLDMTPETYQLYSHDPALDAGKTFSDPEAGVTITTQWANSSNAGVSVIFSQPSCVHANPAVTLSPSSQSAQAGTALTYSVSVANNDNAGCSASSFNLQATVPGGWSASFAAPTLTLSPGASASTTLRVTSPVTATAGFYTIGAKAANSASTAYATTATATYSIVSGLATTLSTDKSSYAAGDTVTITGTATSSGKPVANASVTFSVTKPNGTTVSQTATTNTSGQAVYKLRLNKQKDPSGTYQARATATSNSASANAATSFTVQ